MLDDIPASTYKTRQGQWGQGAFTYNLNFNLIKSIIELLIGPGYIFIDAFLGEATLFWISPVWIPEYFAGLMKLQEVSKRNREYPWCLC